MSMLYHTRATGTLSASTAATGYEAVNANDYAVGRAWRSTTAGASWLQIDLGSSRSLDAICINETNAASVAVTYGASSPPGSTLGTLATHADGQGRRKGRIEGDVARYVRLSFSGTPTDGAAYWTVGSLLLLTDQLAVPDPLLPLQLDFERGQDNVQLPNGRELPIVRGVSRARLGLSWRVVADVDIEAAARTLRAQECWLDLAVADRPDLQWPVSFPGKQFSRRIEGFNRERFDLQLLERA